MKKSIETSVKKRVKGEARKKVQLEKALIGEKGEEILDEQPLFHEVGFTKPPTMDEKIRAITLQVQAEAAAKLQAANMTEEQVQAILDEENDYEVPEELDSILTSYELQDVVETLEEDAFLDVAPDQVTEPVTSTPTSETAPVAETVVEDTPAT